MYAYYFVPVILVSDGDLVSCTRVTRGFYGFPEEKRVLQAKGILG
jgi:hypothetical protein